MSPQILGFVRGLGFAVLAAVLTFLGNAANLAFLSPVIATVVASLALALEHGIEEKTGNALFGAVKGVKSAY